MRVAIHYSKYATEPSLTQDLVQQALYCYVTTKWKTLLSHINFEARTNRYYVSSLRSSRRTCCCSCQIKSDTHYLWLALSQMLPRWRGEDGGWARHLIGGGTRTRFKINGSKLLKIALTRSVLCLKAHASSSMIKEYGRMVLLRQGYDHVRRCRYQLGGN